MRLLVTWPILALLFVPVGQEPRLPREKVDVSKLGPQVGQRVPDFSLKDQTGKVQTLQTPRPRMHVYAPGASDYRVIALTIAPQPFVRVLPVKFPASEIYFFRPLNERVPVYQKAFTLVQEIVPDVTAEAETAFRGKDSLRLTGTLEYQACDDKVCYNPVSVPLSWTLTLRPFERPGRQQ